MAPAYVVGIVMYENILRCKCKRKFRHKSEIYATSLGRNIMIDISFSIMLKLIIVNIFLISNQKPLFEISDQV